MRFTSRSVNSHFSPRESLTLFSRIHQFFQIFYKTIVYFYILELRSSIKRRNNPQKDPVRNMDNSHPPFTAP
uniref:Uncharacterized protein n=1 Tax=Lepeophtheirus salmonis TaxID=72036 RepID=A0A0K2VAN8_LEPSM